MPVNWCMPFLYYSERNALKKILIAAAVLCALIGAGSLYASRNAGNYKDIQSKAEVIHASTAATSVPEKEESAAAATTASSAAVTAEPAEEVPIDFEQIWEDCPDVYAWINIPQTQIDYPVCQAPDDMDQNFYLNHRADRTEEFAGAIYSQNYNSKDFSDPNTVLYGHDMSNGSMFRNLHLYENREFFDQNREVLIYLPDRVLHYRVFAAYNTNDDHILLSHDCFKDPAVFKQYIQDVLEGNLMYSGYIDEDTVLTQDSRLLTLSTCNNVENQRLVVQCVLEK